MVIISNLDISEELDKKLQIEKVKLGVKRKPEAVVKILEKYFNHQTVPPITIKASKEEFGYETKNG